MKVSFDVNSEKVNQKKPISFEGYKFTKSDDGFRELEVSYPFDPDKDKCYVEIFNLGEDKHGNYFLRGKAHSNNEDSRYGVELKPGANRIDLANDFGIADNEPFAYHFLLKSKDGSGFVRTRVDAGDVIDERSSMNENRHIFNVVSPNKSDLSRGGAMKLVIIDSQKVGYVYNDRNVIVHDKALAKRGENGIKTLTNKFGGTLAGLEKAVENGEYDNYGRIISLPIFTDDSFTAHSYWNKNCMQMVHSLGNINNYASLQRKMFAHGLNFVSDGAFVNEGLQGVHFKHVLKWGDKSPYFNWFRASSLKDGPLSMGVFSKNKDFISHKVVNSPYAYNQEQNGLISIQKNTSYDASKPTYIQFFDSRLVTQKESSDTKNLIETYSVMSTPNVYDLHTHNDSIFPYSFEINPESYNENVKNLIKYNRENPDSSVLLSSPKAARMLSKFENFVVDGKFESGFETWDANPDIAKLNFVYSNTDAMSLKNLSSSDRKREMAKILRGNYQVQDYAVSSGKYWTQKTDDILRTYVAQQLKRIDSNNPKQVYNTIMKLSDNKVLPKSVQQEVSYNEVENVLNGLYNNKRVLSDENKQSQILEGLMNMPLDSIEFGDNLVSVLASSMISKRATKPSEVGVSRYDLYKQSSEHVPSQYPKLYKQMDKIYTKEMLDFASGVLKKVDESLPANRKLFNGNEVTDYGKYVVPLVTQDIAKFAVIKALAPKISTSFDRNSGEIAYDYKALKQVSLESVGVKNAASPEDEAQMLIDTLRKGLKNISSTDSDNMVYSISKALKDTSLESFQLADLIIDKTQSGLDWRIDATKDIADVEALRNGNTSFEYTWQAVTDFWKNFVQGVISKNPNAYTVAEVTNEGEIYDQGMGIHSKKYNKRDIVPKFLRETGMTSTANYSYFFTDVAKMFTKCFEDGTFFSDPAYMQKILFEKMISSSGGEFIRSGSLDSIMFSYTFIGNHDKPRALHCAAMDMQMFYTDLTYPGNKEYRKKAYQIINDKFFEDISDYEVEKFDFSAVSPKAIAMADALRPAFMNVLNQYRDKYHYDEQTFNNAFKAISKSISDLAQGKFNGRRFDPEAFGCKPIDVNVDMVLKQAKLKYGFSLPEIDNNRYRDEVFEAVLKPGISKLMGMMKYLVALPGMPTLFDGDDAGASGYDSKTKNMYLQGRQRIHDEWLTEDSDKYKAFLANYKGWFDHIMSIRKNPKCNALNNGAVYTLPQNKAQQGQLVTSILRQSTDGRMAISIFNPTGFHVDHRNEYRQDNIYLDRLYFTESGDGNSIGISGMKEGTKFVNANDEKDVYYSRIDENNNYYLARHCNGKDVPLYINDTTLVLYHVPENNVPLTFTGSNSVKPVTAFVADAYANKQIEQGKQLAMLK